MENTIRAKQVGCRSTSVMEAALWCKTKGSPGYPPTPLLSFSLQIKTFGVCPMMHSPDLFCMRISGFPDSSAGKESACNAGDPSSIPGSERSIGEKIGYPLQYSWASLMAQLVKNLPAMPETWVRSLGWEDPLEKEKATHSSILA